MYKLDQDYQGAIREGIEENNNNKVNINIKHIKGMPSDNF